MTAVNLDKLRADLKRDEGLRLKPYLDTVGKTTIGIGRNLSDIGISEREALMLLDGDLEWVVSDLDRNMPWWRRMPEPAQRALANMTFQMGISKILMFKNMITSLRCGKFKEAAKHALDSKWARQTPERADRIAKMYEDCSEKAREL